MTQKYEIGSQWETRGGWYSRVLEVCDKSDDDLPLLVWHKNGDEDETGELVWHYKDGINLRGQQTPYDLLRPWVEKRRGWVNVYDVAGKLAIGVLHDSREEADRCSNEGVRIACVEWVEGMGVDDGK